MEWRAKTFFQPAEVRVEMLHGGKSATSPICQMLRGR